MRSLVRSIQSHCRLALSVVGVSLSPLVMQAQTAISAPTPAEYARTFRVPVDSGLARGPVEAPRALTNRVAVDPRAVPQRDPNHVGAGSNVAMMVVGVAGIITGSIVGGGGGAAIAVGGGVIGLVGLYRYMR